MAAGVACSLGKSHPMTNYLNEVRNFTMKKFIRSSQITAFVFEMSNTALQVFDHAQRFEDKLDSMSVFIQSLIQAGKSQEALDNVLSILSYLGEPLSSNLDKLGIHKELLDVQYCMQQIPLSSWDTMPALKDPLKIKAMVSV